MNQAIDTIYEIILNSIKSGKTLDEACKIPLSLSLPADQVAEARARYESLVRGIRTLKEPPTMVEPGMEPWYSGPNSSDVFWPALKRLLAQNNWTEETINSLDTASTKVVSLLEHPGLGSFHTKGLVLGYVQSGKTANFTSVIAKAADAGYRMFIVLSGTTDKLRNQTQRRLLKELTDLNPERWMNLTDVVNDFRDPARGTATALLSQYSTHRILCVVKKNSSRLEKLLKWLTGASQEVKGSCPVIIVDDEADQASINTSKDPNGVTKINGLIRDIIFSMPKTAYIGYTATPFANVLIDPHNQEDLYPRNFIMTLPKPKDYFGAEDIFGRDRLSRDEGDEDTDGLDIIRTVPLWELPSLQPRNRAKTGFNPQVTKSLREALLYFFLCVAARKVKGQSDQHSTMLIHTTLYSHAQAAFATPVKELIAKTVKQLKKSDPDLLQEMRAIWEKESTMVTPDELPGHSFCNPLSFDELFPCLAQCIADIQIVIENFQTLEEERLDYTAGPGAFIVIGGNILSRGLTLEGLIVSLFVRSSNAYDTLLQMGRWFGYRRGYADLPRIWMTDDLKGHFFDLATIEAEIRHDIRRYEAELLTPMQFAPRIRQHKVLAITARLKMQRAVLASISYGDSRLQTIHFDAQNAAVLNGNIAAARSLVDEMVRAGCPHKHVNDVNLLFRNVKADCVIDFLRKYSVHEKSADMRQDLLLKYIKAERERGSLNSWNVAFISKKTAGARTLSVGHDFEIPLINRSRLNNSTHPACIKALVSPEDMIIDIEDSDGTEKSFEKMIALRNAKAGTTGLLLLYPIDKDSKPGQNTKKPNLRASLGAVTDVMGLSLVFPKSLSGSFDYMTADLSGQAGEIDWFDGEE